MIWLRSNIYLFSQTPQQTQAWKVHQVKDASLCNIHNLLWEKFWFSEEPGHSREELHRPITKETEH